MLDAAGVEMGDVVVRRVISLDTVGESKVERRQLHHGKLGQVRVVRDGAVDARVHRSRARAANSAKRADGGQVTGTSLEHERSARRTARLEVDHDGDVFRPRMLPDEGRRAEKTWLLTVGEEHDHVVGQWRLAGTNRTRGLEDGCRAGAIVARGRTSLDAVVVRHDEHRLPRRIGARHPREDVLHSPRFPVPRADRGGFLDLRVQPNRRELSDDVIANAVVIGHPDSVRANGDLLHVPHGAFRGENRVRCGGWNRSRRKGRAYNRPRTKKEQARCGRKSFFHCDEDTWRALTDARLVGFVS